MCRRADAEDPIEKALLGLPKDGLRVLLEYVREWNTKPKFCHVAQFVLFRVLRSFSPTDILEVIHFPSSQGVLTCLFLRRFNFY